LTADAGKWMPPEEEQAKPQSVLGQQHGQAKIADVHAYAVKRAIYVKVVADDGTAGWGESGHSGGLLCAALVNQELAPLIKGADVFDADPLWSRMYFEVDELGPSGLAAQAIAGVDCALWDLRGKLLQLPVWKLLGGSYRQTIPLYGSFSRSKSDTEYLTPAECARHAATLVAEGFRAIKVRLEIREEHADPTPDPAIPSFGKSECHWPFDSSR
jgi:L-alanine-DL-glutamate epimerase-like enolase superfamily enzyme